jgi:anaerobic selenocysteine-containing dehydrogenase
MERLVDPPRVLRSTSRGHKRKISFWPLFPGFAMSAVLKPNTDAATKLVHVSCPHDCPDACSLLVTVDKASGKAIKVEGDPSHPYTRGYLCGKVNHYLDYVYSERRVLYPRKRVGAKGPRARTWERISWDEALTTIADRLKTIIAEHGAEAIQPYSYSGTLGNLGFAGMSERFWNKMGAARLLRTICTAAGSAARLATTGNADEADPEDVVNAEIVILWATNLVSTGVHMMPFIQKAKENGAKIIAIDPRPTRTTQFADWHIQPKPGTDAALALGMMKIIVDRGMHDEAFLRANTVGWDKLIADKLPDYPLERVAEITGLAAKDIEQLALEYGATKKSFIRLNWGIQRHDNGGMAMRSIRLLPAITGAWANGGGCCISTGPEMRGFDMAKLQRPDLLAGRDPRTINMIQIGQALNDTTLAPSIKALFVWNSDPANCVPDTKSARAGMLRKDLFTVVHDTFFTDTCDYADIVLPADTQLEHMDLHSPYGQYHFGLSMPAIEKVGESLDNQELFRRLAKHMGYTEECFTQSDEDMIRDLIDPELNPLFEGVTLERLKRDGWAKANLKSPRRMGINSGKWPTPSGKIEIYSETLKKQGLDPLPTYVPEAEGLGNAEAVKKFPLQVISSAVHYFIGSSFQEVVRLEEMQARPTFEVSAEDALERGLKDGDFCRLYNDRGETFGYARITRGLKKGVLGAPKQFNGSSTPGGLNVNALVSQRVADMGGSPVFYSTLAQLEKAPAGVGDVR